MKRGEFALYLFVILIALWSIRPDDAADIRTPRLPEAAPGQSEDLPPLPVIGGERFVVEDAGPKQNSVGTAFAIDDSGDTGLWITARHVVRDCRALGFAVPGRRTLLRAGPVWIHPHSDMALVQGPEPRAAFKLAPQPADRAEDALHVGYPRGLPGDVWSKVIGPTRMITRGRFRSDEPAIAYAEMRRHPPFTGSLGGISGGPIFNAAGDVIGVTVAGNPRRGRIIGTAPRSFAKLFEKAGRRPQRALISVPRITPDTLKNEGDRLRRSAVVSRLHCLVDY